MLLVAILASPALSLFQTQSTADIVNQAVDQANDKLKRGDFEQAVRYARTAIAADPTAEYPVRILVDALTRADKKREALTEADLFVAKQKSGALLLAQRGFLRQELGDLDGAVEDFGIALKMADLATDQRQNIEKAIIEAKAAQVQVVLAKAEAAVTRGDFEGALELTGSILLKSPDLEAAVRIRIDALSRAGRKNEAISEADRFLARGQEAPLLLAQRGYLRRELGDFNGAADDFDAALKSASLTSEQRFNIEAAFSEARTAEIQNDLDEAQKALSTKNYKRALELTESILQRAADSEYAMRIRIEAFSRAGKKRVALAEANKFIAGGTETALLHAQRGFLRWQLGEAGGASADFIMALHSDTLTDAQRRNIQAALAEVRGNGLAKRRLNQAQAALTREDFDAAIEVTGSILKRDPKSDSATRIRIDALSRSGKKREALAEADRLINQGYSKAWVYTQRGFLRRDLGDPEGAIKDFSAALAKRDLDSTSAANVRYARTETAARLAESQGDIEEAGSIYRQYVMAEPTSADGWYNLGYFMQKQGRSAEAAEALTKGTTLRPVGQAYLDAASANRSTNAPLASKLFRIGLDRWYAGDPSLKGRSSTDLERIKNEVVVADQSIRTTVGFGGITGRPGSAGGDNTSVSAETVVRFDGRYLVSIPMLELVALAYRGKDANGSPESAAGVGLRLRPFPYLDFTFGGRVEYFFQPDAQTQFVPNWGLSLGADPYPYTTLGRFYWDFGAIGAYRTGESRYLQDVRANVGYLYGIRSPVRAAFGPTILAVASYDSKANDTWASGIGPSLLSKVWLGGDKYRSYDAVLNFQIAYLLRVGASERARGWRGQAGVTF